MWQTVTFGELCKMYQPKTLSAKEMKAEGAYVVYGANGAIGHYDQYNHAAPQLLVTCRGGTCGSVNVSEPYSWINGNAMVIQPDTTKVSLRYMEYICRGAIDWSAAITGAAQPQITRKSIEPILFSYPPLAEQERIVAKLDESFAEINRAIAVTEAQQAEIENLQATLLSTTLLSGHRDWQTVRLGAVCDIHNGGTPRSKVDAYWGGDVQWLTPKDMGQLQSHLVSKTERQITTKGLEESAAKLVAANSIILSCRAPIGYIAINQVPMAFNQGCKALVPRSEIQLKYLYYFLFESKQLLNDLGTGTTFKEISKKTLAQVKLPLPPMVEQQRIVTKLDAAFAVIQTALDAIVKAKENYLALKSTVMAHALQPGEGA
jgi:type I restriction enzyme S subunit